MGQMARMLKGVRTRSAIALLVLLTALTAGACSGRGQAADPSADLSADQAAADTFIRIDRDDPEAWKGELDNVRFLPEVRMSGSAQFSEDQFHDLADRLRETGKDVVIVDCRLESHGFINGIAVSWCGKDNAANAGMSAEEVMEAEEKLSSLTGTSVTAYTAENDEPAEGTDLEAETWKTEKALAEEEGFGYLRLACPDHCWPPAEVIDSFIAYAGDLPEDTWLHFHCQAGSGRTGAFMTIFEMMQRPGVPVEEILQHQADTGSGNLVDRAKPEKSHAQKERCVLARAAYLYIQENRGSGYAVTWSDWLKDHSETVVLKTGDALEGEGFSSDPLVMTDSLEAVSQGQATVLADGIVYFVTVE